MSDNNDSWAVAATFGDVATMNQLIKTLHDKGIDINDYDHGMYSLHETALHLAAENGHAEIVDILIKAGADVDALDRWGCTPLHAAVWNVQSVIAKNLVRNGANVLLKNDDCQETALYHAAMRGFDPDCVTFLIENGADVNCVNNFGRTPLHTAAKHGHMRVAEILIEHGAKVNAADMRGVTPLDCAVTFGAEKTARFLKNTMLRREHARLLSIALRLQPLALPVLVVYTIYTSKVCYPKHAVPRYNAWNVLKRLNQMR